MQEIFKMAGDVAAHSIWSVSSGDTLTPILGSMDKESRTRYQRIAFDDAEEAHQYGQNSLNKNENDAKGAVFSVDGYITLDSGKTDAVILDVRVYGATESNATIAIPYRHAKSTGGFAVHRPKLVKIEKISQGSLDELMSAFFDGIDGHEFGSKLWHQHSTDRKGQLAVHGDFSAEEWDVLLNSPFMIFFAVAAADGRIDAKEVKQLAAAIQNGNKYKNDLLQQLLAETGPRIPIFIEKLSRGGFNFREELMRACKVVDGKLSKDQASEFKRHLYAFGKDIAESSGGFFGLGSKISKEEKAALAGIALIFSIDA